MTSTLALMYICVKCTDPHLAGKADQKLAASNLPDSHVSGQLSGLKVWANNNEEETVLGKLQSFYHKRNNGFITLKQIEKNGFNLGLSKFQVLVQKEGKSLHSDTQLHEVTARVSRVLLPWLEPVSWLVRTVETRRQSIPPSTPSSSSSSVQKAWLLELTHQHQLDAWNCNFSLELSQPEPTISSSDITSATNNKISDKWRLSVHQLNLSSHPSAGMTPSSRTLSIRQTKLSVSQSEASSESRDLGSTNQSADVLSLGQVDIRMCQGASGNQLDLMLNGTNLNYNDAIKQLVTDCRDFVRPVLLKSSPGKMPSRQSPSIAVVVSQSRFGWSDQSGYGLVLELRELEAAGSSTNNEVSVSGVKLICVHGSEEDMQLISLPSLSISTKDPDIRVTLNQRLKLVWQPSVHILATRCAAELKKLASSLSQPQLPRPQEMAAPKQKILHVTMQEKVSLSINIGEHLAKWTFSSLTLKYTGKDKISWLQSPKEHCAGS